MDSVSSGKKRIIFCIHDIILNQELVFVAQNRYFQMDPDVGVSNMKQQLEGYLEQHDFDA